MLSLSLSYYHESPEDVAFDSTIYAPLRLLGECGVAVVCSVGNDATTRPAYPAALAPWSNGKGTVKPEKDVIPIVSVGALNPNGTDAMFSNAGPWVRAYAPGASVMSTVPPMRGGYQPMAQTVLDGRRPGGARRGRLQQRLRAVERYLVRGAVVRRLDQRAR